MVSDQYSCMLAVSRIIGFVGELACLHQRNRYAEKQRRHGNGTADIPVDAV